LLDSSWTRLADTAAMFFFYAGSWLWL